MKLELTFKIKVDVKDAKDAGRHIGAALNDVRAWSEEVLMDGPGVSASTPLPQVGPRTGSATLNYGTGKP